MQQVALLTYSQLVGWRTVALSYTESPKAVAVVNIGQLKLLRVKTQATCRPGTFCNPRKLIKH